MTAGGETAPAGWYADPHGVQVLRYWDGASWTEHIARLGIQDLPAVAMQRAAGIARWARVGIVLRALFAVVGVALGILYLTDIFDGANFDENAFRLGSSDFAVPVRVVGLVIFAAELVIAFWCYRAADSAAKLGIPLRRSPGWALGSWYVPILSYWWPAQNIRTFVPDDRFGAEVWRWWGIYLAEIVVLLAAEIVGVARDLATALPLLAVASLLAVLQAGFGWQVVGAVTAGHQRRADDVGLTTADVVT